MTIKSATFTGTVKKSRIAEGSKSERDAVVLEIDNAHGLGLVLKLANQNPFDTSALEPFVGKRVSVAGNHDAQYFIIKNLNDITVLDAPKCAARPQGPKF